MSPARILHLDPGGRLANPVFFADPRVAAIMDLLNQEGELARIVGGAVRNALIGLPPGDIDVTTTALPEVVTARAKARKLRIIPTGVAHGTVTVVVSGMPFEVTTLRQDVETDGRHAIVRFGRDFTQDALRRDFTINALSVDAEGRVHDYAGGLDDLAEGRVRFIGVATARIQEDYLRILRFFRFSALYGIGALDPSGLAAASADVGGLSRLSRERVRAEMLKLLVATQAATAVAAMAEGGILSAILGDPCWPARYARLVAIEAVRETGADAILSLAALSLRRSEDVLRLRDRLRLSNEERDRLLALAEAVEERQFNPNPPDALELVGLLFRLGRQAALDAVTLAHVDSDADAADARWQQAAARAASTPVPALPMSGADVMARGVRSGPLVGQVLKRLQARWIRAGFPDQPALLHRLLDDAIDAARRGLPDDEC